MALKFYNTARQEKEDFKPESPKPGPINIYSCGPTVYDNAHIGNLRSYIFADILVRTLALNEYKVNWVINITDIDDKTIKSAVNQFGEKTGVDELKNYTEKYFQLFLKDLEKLNIQLDKIKFIKVTDIIPEIQDFIIKLMEKGYAYQSDDKSVYFSIEKYQQDFGDYGELVGKKFIEGKKVGVRTKADEYEKDNLSDFALWKARIETDNNVFWDHPILGPGRPGWHIECSAINKVAFDDGIVDIHTGGVDLIFPHHTNEIAQSKALSGKNFVNYWLHSNHLMIDGKKMSKSLGNVLTLDDLITKNFDPIAYRYFLLQAGYNQLINYTLEAQTASATAYNRLVKNISLLNAQKEIDQDGQIIEEYKIQFETALADNLNTGNVLAIIQNLIFDKEQKINDRLATIYFFDKVLGLKLLEMTSDINIPQPVLTLKQERDISRENKDWATADTLREEIKQLGFDVVDTKKGSFLISF